jgi:hypothetical protein
MNEHINPADVDPWSWWRNALAGHRGPVAPGEMKPGCYRDRKDALYYVLMDGEIALYVNGNRQADMTRAAERFDYCSQHPIPFEAYEHRVVHGMFPNDNPAVMGHNNAPTDDSVEAINERLADLKREADKLLEAGAATSQDMADQASDLANTFGELEDRAAKLHKKEKEPHLEAGRVVDRKWFPLRDMAADLKKRLKAVVVTPWLVKKKEEADRAALLAVATGTPTEQLPEVRMTAGSSKRSTGLRTKTEGEITDLKAFVAYLIENNNPALLRCAKDVADAFAKASVEAPGMKIVKNKVAQ